MSVGVRMKKGTVRKPADRRRNKNIPNGKERGNVHEMDDSDGEVFYRVEGSDRFSNSNKKGRNLRPHFKPTNARFQGGEENDSNPSRWRSRNVDPSKKVGKERKYLIREGRNWSKNDFSKTSKPSELRLFTQKPTKAMQTVVHGDESEYDRSSRCYDQSKKRSMKNGTSSEKMRLKTRKFDAKSTKSSHGDDAEEEKPEKHGVINDGESHFPEQKSIKRPSRMMDKTGKMRRVEYKPLKNSSTDADTSRKNIKRVIKLDPYDISNKRIVDGILESDISEEKDNAVEKDNVVKKVIELSMNAQFRAIQPSDETLSFVEDNLLGRRRLIELRNAGYNVKLSAPLDNVPFSTASDRERLEESVFRNKLEFFAAAKIASSFPPSALPEIAFAGRSNVGKSSLLNALTRQWGVVRTSDKPGLTQTINFFKLASKLCLVDLPGYGFAYAKDEIKEAWEELVKEFVTTRVGLQRVCLLVDTKWGMKARDFELVDLMERSKTPYQIVLTKTDMVFPIDVARRATQIQEILKKNKSIVDPMVMVSSKSGAGIRNLRTVLAKLARFVKP